MLYSKLLVLLRTQQLGLPLHRRVTGVYPSDDDAKGKEALHYLMLGVLPTVFVADVKESVHLLMHKHPQADGMPQGAALLGWDSAIFATSEQAVWQKQLIVPVLYKNAVQKYRPVVSEMAQTVLASCSAQPKGVSVLREARKYTSMIIYRIVMGAALTYDEIDKLHNVHATLFDGFFALPINLPFTPFGKALHARRTIARIVDRRIRQYQRSIRQMTKDELMRLEINDDGACTSGDSILHNIMLTAEKNGRRLSRKVLSDTCISLLIGGADTSASLITVVLFLIARGPSFGPDVAATPAKGPSTVDNSIWRELVAEVQAAGHQSVGQQAADATVELRESDTTSILKACIWEGLRLAPPLPAVRRPVKSTTKIGSHTVPQGAFASLAILPNKHDDPMRQSLANRQRRCPLDVYGNDRSSVPHDAFDFDPWRWIVLEKSGRRVAGAAVEDANGNGNGARSSSNNSFVPSSGQQKARKRAQTPTKAARYAQSRSATAVQVAEEVDTEAIELGGPGCPSNEPGFVEFRLSPQQRRQQHLPFGLGPHACSGRHLALLSIETFFVELLHHYNVEVVEMPRMFERTRGLPKPVPNFSVRLVQRWESGGPP